MGWAPCPLFSRQCCLAACLRVSLIKGQIYLTLSPPKSASFAENTTPKRLSLSNGPKWEKTVKSLPRLQKGPAAAAF